MVGRKPQGQAFELFCSTRKRMYGFLGQWGGEALGESWKWLRYSPQPTPSNTQPESHIWDSSNIFSHKLGQKAWKNLWSWAPKSAMRASKLQSWQVNKRKLKQKEGKEKKKEEKPYGWKPVRAVKAAVFEGYPALVGTETMWEGNNLLKVTPKTISGT